MQNKHTSYDLVQMQSLPLEAKIEMTKRRIEEWYKAWKKYAIVDRKTGKTRYVTWTEEPNETGCFRKKVETVDGQKTEVDVMVSGTKLKPTEYVESCEDGQVYVSFSGGKDSTVLKHIVDSMYKDVPALFINTGLEYPEIQKFARAQEGVIEVRPEMRFDNVIKTYGYPIISKDIAHKLHDAWTAKQNGYNNSYVIRKFEGRYVSKNGKTGYNCQKWGFLLEAPFKISHKCCDVMKKTPAKKYERESGRKPIIGSMAEEGKMRKQSWLLYGCNAFDSERQSSKPMSFWREQDVLEYIKKYQIPICPVYGNIVEDSNTHKLTTTKYKRTGCIFCGFGCHIENESNKFFQLKESHPRQYDYCINGGEYNEDGQWQPNKEGLGLGKVFDYIGVPYE